MNWRAIVFRFPQWAVAAAIVIVSLVLFVGWFIFRKPSRDVQSSGRPIAEGQEPSLDFRPGSVILCGNTLIERSGGEILANEWLDGLGSAAPPLAKIIEGEKLVIVKGDSGAVGAFGFDGKPKPSLFVDGKGFRSAAFDQNFTSIIYPRDGNLWLGKVDFSTGKVLKPKRFTDTGYFRDDVFKGHWLWHEDDLLVSVMGKTLEVDLPDGAIKQLPIHVGNLQQGMSPDGSFVIINTAGGEAGILDLMSGESKKFSFGPRIRKFLWLSPRSVMFFIGQGQLAHYDHDTKKLAGPWTLQEPIADIAEVSPDGKVFLAVQRNKLGLLNAEGKIVGGISLRLDYIEWLSSDFLLGSSHAADTETRGLWLLDKHGKQEKLTGQPIDGGGRTVGIPMVVQNSEAYFVSGGDLWSFKLEGRVLKQLTQGQKLPPRLQLLKN